MRGKKSGPVVTQKEMYTEGQVLAQVRRTAEVVALACGADLPEAIELIQNEVENLQRLRDSLQKQAERIEEKAQREFALTVGRAEAERDERLEDSAQLRQQADEAEVEMSCRLDLLDLFPPENTPESD